MSPVCVFLLLYATFCLADSAVNPLSDDDSYMFRYKIGNLERREQGFINNNNDSLRVTGFYNFIGINGQIYRVNYIADDNGYRADIKLQEEPPQEEVEEKVPASIFIGSAAIGTLIGGGLG